MSTQVKGTPKSLNDPRWYPVDDVKRGKKVGQRRPHKKQVLRASIVPGTVLILLGTKHKGKRVIFLKQLKSGLLLVTGPFSINKCPLTRVNAASVIATSTKVDIAGVKVPASVTDDSFRQQKKYKKAAKNDKAIFQEEKKPEKANEVLPEQEAIDGELLKCISKIPMLKKYLATKFGLKNDQYPHLMKF